MGGGLRFGGDCLVYPGSSLRPFSLQREAVKIIEFAGDPLRHHLYFVASVIDSSTSAIRPMRIVAHGRLGTATNLLYNWDDGRQEVKFFD